MVNALTDDEVKTAIVRAWNINHVDVTPQMVKHWRLAHAAPNVNRLITHLQGHLWQGRGDYKVIGAGIDSHMHYFNSEAMSEIDNFNKVIDLTATGAIHYQR